jgi:hypothetical protein
LDIAFIGYSLALAAAVPSDRVMAPAIARLRAKVVNQRAGPESRARKIVLHERLARSMVSVMSRKVNLRWITACIGSPDAADNQNQASQAS